MWSISFFLILFVSEQGFSAAAFAPQGAARLSPQAAAYQENIDKIEVSLCARQATLLYAQSVVPRLTFHRERLERSLSLAFSRKGKFSLEQIHSFLDQIRGGNAVWDVKSEKRDNREFVTVYMYAALTRTAPLVDPFEEAVLSTISPLKDTSWIEMALLHQEPLPVSSVRSAETSLATKLAAYKKLLEEQEEEWIGIFALSSYVARLEASLEVVLRSLETPEEGIRSLLQNIHDGDVLIFLEDA